MTPSANWIQAIKTLVPEYDDLVERMDEKVIVRAFLKKEGIRWTVWIKEDWTGSTLGHLYYTATYDEVDKRIEWAEQQLASWKFVSRVERDQWCFFSKKQAEKFITLFNLRWGM